jgi:anti-sigma regulatory factor (Ser/Thr protein kinase)
VIERERYSACDLEGGAGSIGKAREHARRFLADAESAIPDRTVADVLLAVSELVTNAVMHAPGPCTLEITLNRRQVYIGVTDTSGVLPVPRPPEYDGSGGLGLHMLRALTGDVETRLHEYGKTVGVRITRGPRSTADEVKSR